jgi:hypothetical protein
LLDFTRRYCPKPQPIFRVTQDTAYYFPETISHIVVIVRRLAASAFRGQLIGELVMSLAPSPLLRMPRHLTEGSSGSSQQLRIGAAIQLHSAAITKVQPWCDGHHKRRFY